MKWWSALLALPFLVACDKDKLPSPPSLPTTPEVQPSTGSGEPVVSLEPAPTLGAENEPEGPEAIEIEVQPVTDGDSEKLPSERVVSVPPPKPAAPNPVKKKTIEQVELPEAELDLSLPEDWTNELDPGQETAVMSLLPPLFESSESSRSVQMTGRLLPGMDEDEVIDGAEINFELKR